MEFKKDYIYDISYDPKNKIPTASSSTLWRSISICTGYDDDNDVTFLDIYSIKCPAGSEGPAQLSKWYQPIQELNSYIFDIIEMGHIKDFPEYEL